VEARLDRRTVVAVAVLMPLGPACVAVLRGILPTFSSTKATEMAAAVASAPGRQSAVVWLGYAATLLLVPGVLAAARVTRAQAPRLTWWAMALLVPAYLSLAGLVAGDALLWSGNDAGLGTSTVATLSEHAHPATNVAVVLFVLGHIVGTVLLGLALRKSRQVPAVLAWGLTVSQPLHFVAGIILGLQALDAFAWGLTAVGMAAAAVALLRQTGRNPRYAGVAVPA
jgi:hypothetical protein